ncbi:PrsW family glutamic-type intramembrane protease [Nocardioides sp. GY 10113]|uniref:PrsW family glutamic-type intramembrane protease n=1 Tax=Nocardioides sp. GY 10113 TaxID=2569761 RepID=UPI001458407B|nr:PrsW family glutamic-type intramembrane protease [Nocardioides sp. GY 10113]
MGGGLWTITLASVAASRNEYLVPTLLVLGAFTVPVATVAFALDRVGPTRLDGTTVLQAFLAGGLIGLVVAATLESSLLPAVNFYLGVAVIEELVKGLLIVAFARQVRTREPRVGMVLGAVVGAGFAAFESMGYAFNALVDGTDRPLLAATTVAIARAAIAPLAHITWSAILGGALFASAARTGRYLTVATAMAWAGVTALHALWDIAAPIAIVVNRGMDGWGWDWSLPLPTRWMPHPDVRDAAIFVAVYGVQFLAITAVGTWWLARAWRHGAQRVR